MRLAITSGVLILTSIAMVRGSDLELPLADGEAQIRYLSHAGWLVRTAEHCLVFDYVGTGESDEAEGATLLPDELRDCRVVMFVSHGHGDHYDRRTLSLREAVEDVTVVMGWREPESGEVVVPGDGEWTDVSGAEVLALHHRFDGIPEGFFLVRSGGLTIYHSGDHGTWSEPPGEAFKANIDQLAAASESIDIAFLSSFGQRAGRKILNQGDLYTLQTLAARIVFPMHCGGCEERYAGFAREASALGLPTKIGVADAPGASFHYREGELR